MKRLIFSSLSVLLFSSAILPAVKAEIVGSDQLSIGKQNQDYIPTNSIVQNQATAKLTATANDGTPETMSQEEWLAAEAEALVSDVDPDSYTVTIRASNLVPDGLYTLWWVNKKLVGMDMGPVSGTPANEFRADEEGNAIVTVTVPADNDYQTIVAAYHADDRTHGEMPGEMGKVTFGHLMGDFPQVD